MKGLPVKFVAGKGKGKNESCAFLTSNKKITLCGCYGVKKYSENEITVTMCDQDISISGVSLTVSTFLNGEISVTGAIESIALHKKEGRGRV